MEKIAVYFEKYANFERKGEPCSIAVPFPEGELWKTDSVVIRNKENRAFPTQPEITAKWPDGSIKWLYIDFLADLPANGDIYYYICFDGQRSDYRIDSFSKDYDLLINSGGESFAFEKRLDFSLNGRRGRLKEKWEKIKDGEVCCAYKSRGDHDGFMDFEITVTAYRECPWIRADYRIINREREDCVLLKCLDLYIPNRGEDRFTIATSNYLSNFVTGDDIRKKIDAAYLLYDANEHFAEVFYGTFFGDMASSHSGTAVSVYQAYQNFPSEISINREGMRIGILAAEDSPVRFFRGMAKNSTVFIHKHRGASKEEINLRSLMFQMPDKGTVPAEVFERSGVFPDIFLPKKLWDKAVERNLIQKLDSRGRAYGFVHWGDNIDRHYTNQGRGMGRPVWVNNEYDFGHAALLYYVRTGVRRALDSMLVSVRHQMDTDIVHCSDDPMRLDGQVTHSADHISGKVEISHMWTEGLLDYYHFTGDREALDTALRLGENVIRQLSKPRYKRKGGVNARETGWALRSLTALYKETNDPKWLVPCDEIIQHFYAWKEEFGAWLAPYTDHTTIRVPFMISIAIISLMSYYSINKDEKIRAMMLDAVDDIVENSYPGTGFFYYKELSSLNRNAGNTTLLQALVIAYELTGDPHYLDYGADTFRAAVSGGSLALSFSKTVDEDAVVISGNSSKGVGQSFLPLMTYYTAAVKAGIKF